MLLYLCLMRPVPVPVPVLVIVPVLCLCFCLRSCLCLCWCLCLRARTCAYLWWLCVCTLVGCRAHRILRYEHSCSRPWGARRTHLQRAQGRRCCPPRRTVRLHRHVHKHRSRAGCSRCEAEGGGRPAQPGSGCSVASTRRQTRRPPAGESCAPVLFWLVMWFLFDLIDVLLFTSIRSPLRPCPSSSLVAAACSHACVLTALTDFLLTLSALFFLAAGSQEWRARDQGGAGVFRQTAWPWCTSRRSYHHRLCDPVCYAL